MEERFRPLTFHGLVLRSQLVNLLVRGVCYAENESVRHARPRRQPEFLPENLRMFLSTLQSATQPRLSYAEMTEDYPRYPDIHDLDLTLLNPRMIVVRAARPPPRAARCPWGRLMVCSVCAGCDPVHEPVSLHSVAPHPHLTGLQPVQDDGPETPPSGQRCGGGEAWPRRAGEAPDLLKESYYCHRV